MNQHSHFNCCIDVMLPGEGDPVHVFHYDGDAVAPNISESQFNETIANISAQLSHAEGKVTLSVETVLTVHELTALGSLPSEEIPTFALMDRRFDHIRQRFAQHGLPPNRIETHIL